MPHVTEITVKDGSAQLKTVATIDALLELIGDLGDTAVTNPAAVSASLLALLRGAVSRLSDIGGYTDGLEALNTSLNGYVDGLEALVTSTNGKLDTIHTDLGTTLSWLLTDLKGYVDQLEGYTDGLETLVGSTNSALTTIQGYVDGLETLITATNAALAAATPAGSNEIGKTNVKHINIAGSTLTRPANTTAYAANDSVSDNGTAGSVTVNTVTLSDTNDDPVDITEVLLDSTDTGFGNVQVRLHCFTSDPTASSGVGGGDNAAWSQKRAGWAGSFSGTLVTFSDGAKGTLIPDGAPVRIMNVESAGKRIWWQLQTLGAATPSANSTTFTPRFKGYQGRA